MSSSLLPSQHPDTCVLPPTLGPPPARQQSAATDEVAVSEAIRVDYLAAYNGHTKAAYTRDLVCFFTWCDVQHVAPLNSTRSNVATYLQMLRRQRHVPLLAAWSHFAATSVSR